MRNLFLLLLLANLCAGLWIYTHDYMPGEGDQPQRPRSAVRSLVLLAEVKSEPVAARQAAVVEEPLEVGGAEAGGVQESPAAESVVSAEVEPAAVSGPEAEAPEVFYCYTLGPFTELDKAKRAVRLLGATGAEVERRSSQEQEPFGYRIFIPPLSSKEKAYEVAAELREKGVKDYFVITNPNDKLNGISLGLFSQKTGALKRLAQLRFLGYQASMEIRYREKEIHWLDYAAAENQISEQVLREAGEGVQDIQRLPRNCAE